MGRMLETLRQAQTKRQHPAPDRPADPSWPTDETDPDLAADGDVPFIEVGGPRTRASTAPTAPALAVPSVAPAPAAVEPRYMSVLFRPVACAAPTTNGCSRLAPELIAHHQPGHPISGQYRDLVAAMLAQLSEARSHALLFVGSSQGTGTTTVLLNTAITLARPSTRRVLLVDANLRRSAVAGRLGLTDHPGLREVLGGRLPLEEAIRPSGISHISILSAGAVEAASPIRLAGEGMRSVLRQLREQFDLVLVDGPRWDGRPEVVALGCACDAVYLCMPEAEQDVPEAADLLQIIPEQGAALRGCILTQR